VWTKEWVSIQQASYKLLIDLSDPLIVNFEEPKIVRAAGDRAEHFGDGGYAILCYPIWTIRELPVEENVRQTLLENLRSLADHRKDFQENKVVEVR
jgi:hypothetical protein